MNKGTDTGMSTNKGCVCVVGGRTVKLAQLEKEGPHWGDWLAKPVTPLFPLGCHSLDLIRQ